MGRGKVEVATGAGAGPQANSLNSLNNLLSAELAQIKTVESNILHQLADLR